MRSKNFTLTFFDSLQARVKLNQVLAIALFFMLTGNLNSQNCDLACSNVQVSLDDNCEAIITPSVVLTNTISTTCADEYVVVIKDINDVEIDRSSLSGTTLVHPVIDGSYIGERWKVAIEYEGTENGEPKVFTCWGFLDVEDKLGPSLVCLDDVTVACTDDFPDDLETMTTQTHSEATHDDLAVSATTFGFEISVLNEANPWEIIDGVSLFLDVVPSTLGVASLSVSLSDPNGNVSNGTYNNSTGAFDFSDWNGSQATNSNLTGQWYVAITDSGANIVGIDACELTISSVSIFKDSPLVADNCSSSVPTEFIMDNLVDRSCEGQTGIICSYERIISYHAVDKSGNNSTQCDFTICFSKPDINDADAIDYPDNVILNCVLFDPMEAGMPSEFVSIWDTNLNGYPDPSDEGVGFPTFNGKPLIGTNLCKINVAFTDNVVSICGSGSYKVVRTWRVLDWCTSDTRIYVQNIKVQDEQPPIIACPPDTLTFAIGSNNCFSDVVFEPLNIDHPTSFDFLYECNEFDVEVEFLLADDRNVNDVEDVFTPARNNGDGTFTALDVPADTFWVKYIVTDACGNFTECRFEAFMEDSTKPFAICDQFTAVALGESGWARANAISFDDGSYDSCGGDLRYEVRRDSTNCDGVAGYDRDDTLFGPYLQFCCDDANQEFIPITLKVTDASGNFSTCKVSVQVQDKHDPVIEQCPELFVNISCDDYDPTKLYGSPNIPIVFDNCLGEIIPEYEDVGPLDDCLQGTIIRKWFFTQGANQIILADCNQTFTIDGGYNGSDINFPGDISLSCQEFADYEPIPTLQGTSVVEFGGCAKFAYTFDDLVFTNVEGVCFKILRTHTVIDWCIYKPNENSTLGHYSDTQTIKVSSTSPPDLQECAIYIDEDIDHENCESIVTLSAPWAFDDCVKEQILPEAMSYDIFLNGIVIHNTPALEGNTITLPGLAKGNYDVIFYIPDNCNNVQTCTLELNITETDLTPPSPYCLGGVTTVVMQPDEEGNAFVEIWASDFDLGTTDNCTSRDQLIFSFDPEGQEPNRTYLCSQIGENTVKIYVTDECGNQDFCETTLNIDFNGECPDLPEEEEEEEEEEDCDCPTEIDPVCDDISGITYPNECLAICAGVTWSMPGACEDGDGSSRIDVAGNIYTEDNRMLSEIAVNIENNSLGNMGENATDLEGHYLFENLEAMADYSIYATNDVDYLNGVSTLDLVAIQRHILGLELLDSPFKLIAADANSSESISAIDLVELRKLILGIYTDLPSNDSWRFVDASYTFTDPNRPWPFKESIVLNELADNAMNNHFIAVKIGDVNHSVNIENFQGSIGQRSDNHGFISIEDADFVRSEKLTIPVRAEFNELVGMQLELNYNHELLEFVGIESGILKINESNYTMVQNGKILISWNDANSNHVRSKEIFNLVFIAKENDSVINADITVNNQGFTSEFYTSNLESNDLDLITNSKIEDDFVLLQNEPNPFSGSTMISFYLPDNDRVTLSLVDVSGKVVYTEQFQKNKGMNLIELSADQISESGLLYYSVTTSFGTKVKKMLIVE